MFMALKVKQDSSGMDRIEHFQLKRMMKDRYFCCFNYASISVWCDTVAPLCRDCYILEKGRLYVAVWCMCSFSPLTTVNMFKESMSKSIGWALVTKLIPIRQCTYKCW